jgi:nucleoside-diphosphate-sugar epimerase
MSDRLLVTGAAGFIASRVCELLVAAGHEVVGIDNLNHFYDPRLKQLRLRKLNALKGFSFFKLDVENRAALDDFFATFVPDRASPQPYSAIVHLAARAGVRPSTEDPWAYLRTNVEGTLNLLEICRRFRIPKFVMASSSSVYGATAIAPFREDSRTDRPLSPYAATKAAAEALAYSYYHLYGLDVSALRYFTVYGPAGRPDMAVLRFVRRIAENEPIEVFGDGHQLRDFSYVDDIAAGTIAALRGVGCEAFNLGNDRPVELLETISTIGRLLNRQPKMVTREIHRADVPTTWACIDKARKMLDWSPQVALEEGLRRTVQWYQQHRDELLQMKLD